MEENAVVPEVSWEDVKNGYETSSRLARVGGSIAAVDNEAVAYRIVMLQALVMHVARHKPDDNPFAPWQHGEKFDDAVFKVVAKAPLRFRRSIKGFPFDVDVDVFLQQIRDET